MGADHFGEHWDPRCWEDQRRIERTDHREGISPPRDYVVDIEVDLGATIVERLWGVNGRKQWLAALAEAEKTGAKMP